MAWPPPNYPINVSKTNLTEQVNDHPAHHNAMGTAINDIVPEINSLRSRTTAVESALPGKASVASVNTVAANLADHEDPAFPALTVRLHQTIEGVERWIDIAGSYTVRHGLATVILKGKESDGNHWPGGPIDTQGSAITGTWSGGPIMTTSNGLHVGSAYVRNTESGGSGRSHIGGLSRSADREFVFRFADGSTTRDPFDPAHDVLLSIFFDMSAVMWFRTNTTEPTT